MEYYRFLRNIQDLLSDGKTPYERRFGMPFNGPLIPFGAMVEYHTISAKDMSRLHQLGPKVLPGIFLGYVLYAVRVWNGDIMFTDIEELEEMDASEIHARRLNAKEVLTPMKGAKFLYSQSRMEQSKFLEEIDVWSHPLESGIVLNEERNKKFFEENQTDSLLQPQFKMTLH